MEEMQCFYAKDGRIPFDVQAIGKSICEYNYLSRRECSDITDIEFVTEGAGKITVNGKEYFPKVGDTFIIQTGSNHVNVADRLNPWRKRWITVYGYYVNDLMKAYGLERQVLFHVDNGDLFEKMAELSVANISYEELCTEISVVLQQIVHRCALSVKEIKRVDKIAFEIKKYLDENVENKVNLEDVIKKFYLSKSQIIRIFKKNYDMTPYDYILEKKIESAKILLKNSDMNIRQISAYLGFSDEHYFSNLFLKKTGLRPKEFITK